MECLDVRQAMSSDSMSLELIVGVFSFGLSVLLIQLL
jgi:hypothetical protein